MNSYYQVYDRHADPDCYFSGSGIAILTDPRKNYVNPNLCLKRHHSPFHIVHITGYEFPLLQ